MHLYTIIIPIILLTCTQLFFIPYHSITYGDKELALDSVDFSSIDSILVEAIEEELIPGAVLLVSVGDTTVYHKAFGYAQLLGYWERLNSPQPMTIGHRFDLASLTKVFATTYGIMLLVDRQRIDLDVPINTYLSEFRGAAKDSVTVRHLLTHSGGLKEWSPIYYHAENTYEAKEYISELPLAYPVGTGRHYSDLGFMLLGYIIEEVTGEDLDAFLKANLYQPMGLEYTSFNPPRDGPPFAATSHGNPFEKKMVYDDDFGFLCDEDPTLFQRWRDYVLIGEVNDGNAFYAHGGIAGHAGLFSTAAELNTLLQLLLDQGQAQGRQWLSEEVIERFLNQDQFGHGLGWAMSSPAIPVDELPEGSFGHTGFTGTFVLAMPRYRASIILLTNRQNLDVNADGRYHSLTQLRRKVSEAVIKTIAEN